MNKMNNTPIIRINDETATLFNQEFAIRYLLSVQLPMMVDANSFRWSPETLVTWLETAGIPLGAFATVPSVQTFLVKRRDDRLAAEDARIKAEQLAFYNSPEQVAKRKREAEELHQARIRYASQRGRVGSVTADVTHAATTMFDMYSST